ncbi:hypothetical protein MKX01_040844 [Papaver californicum]|nr:hypothetical protein MKX01_040844 [Papaver californicum]
MAEKLLSQIKCPTNKISPNTVFSHTLVKFRSLFSAPEAYSSVSCNSKTTSYPKNGGLDFGLLFNGYELRNPYFVNRVVSTCAELGYLHLGKQVDSSIIKLEFNSNVFIGSALVDMYCKCGTTIDARQLFYEIPEKKLELFTKMHRAGFYPSPSTISTIPGLCSQSDLGELGVQVHGLGIKTGSCSNVVTGTTLINMYAKRFSVEESRKVFDQMPDKNVITRSFMVSGYAQNHQPDEAIVIVKEMRTLSVKLIEVTYNSLLSSFSSLKYLCCDRQVHGQVIREGLESNTYLDFYKMCLKISIDDQISWNSIIAGFYRLGNDKKALDWFIRMRQACIHIDFFTLSNVLGATGILSALSEVSWHKELCPNDPATNVLLSSILAQGGHWVDAAEVRSFMCERAVENNPGCSWIERAYNIWNK